MPIDFSALRIGDFYSRPTLSSLWGYSSFHAIARGVVTPREDNKIILFVTEEKQDSSEQYQDCLKDRSLEWEGPKDHFGESRILNAASFGEEIHLFYRNRHHSDFEYMGLLSLQKSQLAVGTPSKFLFKLV